MQRSLAVLAFVLVGTSSSIARAQGETTHNSNPPEHLGAEDHGAPAAAEDNLIDPAMKRSWREGATRPFASLTLDAGYLYLRPRGALGYGTPFNTWVGIEGNPIVSVGGYGGYAGLRAAFPNIDLRVGGRYFGAFQHAYLDPKAQYSRLDLDITSNKNASIYTLEAETNITLPLGPGDVIATGSISYVGGIPDGQYVFEETLRVIVVPPWVWRARGGYAFRFGSRNQHSIGPVVDFLNVPKRDDSLTVRLGPVLRVALSRHFDVRGSFVTTVSSPDRLGLVGGDFTELGVRYRTATE